MAHFGDRLRQERERQGVSLEEIARSTKVAPHLLEALESNRLDQLPGGPFNKGFVRSYALALGLDPDELITAYTREERSQGLGRTPDADRELMQEMARLVELRSEGDRRTLVLDWAVVQKILAGVAALLVVLVALWLWLGRGGGPPEQPAAPASPGPAAEAGETGPESGGATREPAPLRAAEQSEAMPGDPEPSAPAPRPSEEQRSPASTVPDTGVTAPPPPASGPAPAPREAPARDQAPAMAAAEAPASRIRIEEAGTGTGVRGRILVGRSDSFHKGDRVWFWNRAMDGRDGEVIRHVWLRNGEVMGSNEIRVGGPHWRNWSWKTMGKNSVGDWAVEVRDSDGRVLERVEFTCLPAEG